MQVLIISGFLGAGKTTFIKELLKHTDKEIAILENELGDISVDTDTLKEDDSQEEINIWELTEGCICCSTKGNFASTILTIANAVDPEYLIVEPTGVGMLGNIIGNIKQIEYDRIGILAPITIVDGHSCKRYLNEFHDIYENQIKFAHSVLISKMEQATADEKQEIVNLLKVQNPNAEIISRHYTKQDEEWWTSILNTDCDGRRISIDESDSIELETFSLTNVSLRSPDRLIYTLENLIRGEFGNIVRAKGFLKANDIGLSFDMADNRYSIMFTESVEDAKIVFIGQDIKRQKLRRFLLADSAHIRVGKLKASNLMYNNENISNHD